MRGTKLKIGILLAFATWSNSPAQAATVFVQNVYATNDAYISGGSYGIIAAGSFKNGNGTEGKNFTGLVSSNAALDSAARAASLNYARMSSTGSLSTGQYTPGDGTLTGFGSGINVFNIDGATYQNLYALSFAGLGSGAIINVGGSSISNFVNINYGSLSPDQVLFNFFDASNVSFGGMNVAGSILAPEARVQIQGGLVAGSVISKSFHSEGATIGGRGFAGLNSMPVGAVPEVSTWLMIIVGFGAVGWAMRRKKTFARPSATPDIDAVTGLTFGR